MYFTLLVILVYVNINKHSSTLYFSANCVGLQMLADLGCRSGKFIQYLQHSLCTASAAQLNSLCCQSLNTAHNRLHAGSCMFKLYVAERLPEPFQLSLLGLPERASEVNQLTYHAAPTCETKDPSLDSVFQPPEQNQIKSADNMDSTASF